MLYISISVLYPPPPGGWGELHHKNIPFDNCNTACTSPVDYGITAAVICGRGIGLKKLGPRREQGSCSGNTPLLSPGGERRAGGGGDLIKIQTNANQR